MRARYSCSASGNGGDERQRLPTSGSGNSLSAGDVRSEDCRPPRVRGHYSHCVARTKIACAVARRAANLMTCELERDRKDNNHQVLRVSTMHLLECSIARLARQDSIGVYITQSESTGTHAEKTACAVWSLDLSCLYLRCIHRIMKKCSTCC